MLIKRNNPNRGFTLLELMVTLGILGILIALAAPSFRAMMGGQQVRSVLNEWRSSFYFAQSEALRLKDGVVFCAANSAGNDCSGKNDFSNGWIVIHTGDDGKVVLQDNVLTDKNITVTLASNVPNGKLSFLGNGRLNIGAGTSLTVKNKDKELKLVISSAGRLRGEG